MDYLLGERVPTKSLTDDEILKFIQEFGDKDYRKILGNNTNEEQQNARLYLQIWYEKFLRGESPLTFLASEARDAEALQAIE